MVRFIPVTVCSSWLAGRVRIRILPHRGRSAQLRTDLVRRVSSTRRRARRPRPPPAAVPGRFDCAQPSRLRCGPLETASAPGGTSRRTTVPPPVPAPSPIVDRRDERVVGAGLGVPADRGAVLLDAVVVGEDRAGADVGALADLGVADVGQVRHLGAVADLRRSWSRRRRRSCRARRARCRGAGRRTGRRSRRRRSPRARRGCARPGRPTPISQSLSVRVRADHGVLGRRRSRRAAGCRAGS